MKTVSNLIKLNAELVGEGAGAFGPAKNRAFVAHVPAPLAKPDRHFWIDEKNRCVVGSVNFWPGVRVGHSFFFLGNLSLGIKLPQEHPFFIHFFPSG